ncbi:uncharacterized protein CLUP02_00798 [Colletotrichum lupini]|uniref:Uncharacterized protein n=1 Tax=Colletotrichum lupini TaxID=145971 RepID=A0A9Q8W9B1_9PEZI|nr:uncharacterized protein CLUP02_00798 [Colletotrichum lupini]UQC74150.1 hypothetical protein CLUP02_00798 [Colletotrichum lupini]
MPQSTRKYFLSAPLRSRTSRYPQEALAEMRIAYLGSRSCRAGELGIRREIWRAANEIRWRIDLVTGVRAFSGGGGRAWLGLAFGDPATRGNFLGRTCRLPSPIFDMFEKSAETIGIPSKDWAGCAGKREQGLELLKRGFSRAILARKQAGKACSLPGLGFFPLPRTMERPLFHHHSVRTTSLVAGWGFLFKEMGVLVDFLTLGDGIWKAAVPCSIHHGPNRRNLTAKADPASPAKLSPKFCSIATLR